MFPAKWKSDETNVPNVRALWEQYRRHELSIKQARTSVFGLAFGKDLGRAIADDTGVGEPTWADSMGNGRAVSQEAQDAEVLQAALKRLENSGEIAKVAARGPAKFKTI